METPIKSIVTRTLIGVLLIGGAACSPRQDPVLTVQDLLDDRVKLDGVLLKCNQSPASTNRTDCVNARIAAAKISTLHDEQKAAKRNEDFEKRREELRLQQDRERQSQDAQKPDAYHLPVVPVDAPKDSPPQGQATAARN
jgi:hypothetical protein